MLIESARFLLRPLNPEDATARYSGWFEDQDARNYIASASRPHSVEHLRTFIAERSNRDDVLFLGIFDKKSQAHIGNIKYEPIDVKQGFAVMGIFIGEKDWRGKGVGTEVIRESGLWLHRNKGIREIILGVDRNNHPAVRSYEKIGFSVEPSKWVHVDRETGLTMVWRPDTSSS